MEKYVIKWFNSKNKQVQIDMFNSFEEALNFGKLTLENFNTDLITKIKTTK